MVKFIKQNGELFSVARDAETAFYMWKTAQKLNHTIEINGLKSLIFFSAASTFFDPIPLYE